MQNELHGKKFFFIKNILMYIFLSFILSIIIFVALIIFHKPREDSRYIDESLMFVFSPIGIPIYNIFGMSLSIVSFKKIMPIILSYLFFIVNTSVFVFLEIYFAIYLKNMEEHFYIHCVISNIISGLIVIILKKRYEKIISKKIIYQDNE